MDKWDPPIGRGEGGGPPNGEAPGAGPTAVAPRNGRAGLDGAAGASPGPVSQRHLAAGLAPLPASVSPAAGAKPSVLGCSSCTSRAQ